ncbi:MAG: hypothetical protein ACI3Z0_00870 [Candidatus Cryptobacteroides sp.]
MGLTIAEPAPRYVHKLKEIEYVIGGLQVRKTFGKKAIFINSDSIASINKGVAYARDRALEFPARQYYATPVGKARGDNSQYDIALQFTPILFLPNVHLPEDYIRDIVNEAHSNNAFAAKFNPAERSALRNKWYDLNKETIRQNYSDLFIIFDDREMNFSNELVDLIVSSEAGINDNGESLNQIRCVLECVFERMMEMKMLPDSLRGSGSECGRYIKNIKDLPVYIKNYIFDINGIVNSGCHAWLKQNGPNQEDRSEEDNKQKSIFIKYRNSVNNGELPYLIRSLVFMLLCVVDWCGKEMGKRNVL